MDSINIVFFLIKIIKILKINMSQNNNLVNRYLSDDNIHLTGFIGNNIIINYE